MRFDLITIFPGFFAGFFEHGIVRRAQADGLVEIGIYDLRAFTHDRHRTVDDRPFGGGEGMVLKPEPLARAMETLGVQPRSAAPTVQPFLATPTASGHDFSRAATAPEEPGAVAPDRSRRPTVILTSPQGRRFDQSVARELAQLDRIVLICGRYEGVDERINELYCDMELSIGDYVLSGGELAAAIVVDATMRLIPGVLGNEASGEFESFGAADASITTDIEGVPRSQHGSGGLLDYPHYTRPAEFAGLKAPEVLLKGDHQQIRRWRREQQLRKTLKNRPDLLERAALTDEDKRILAAIEEQREQ
jgi:tRNA (guanine37-N1)-methyltransferase